MGRALAVVVALSTLSTPAHADAGSCRDNGGFQPRVLSGTDLWLGSDGGVVVGLEPSFVSTGTNERPTLVFRDDSGDVAAVKKTLAPGLVVYRRPAKDTRGLRFDSREVHRLEGKPLPLLDAPSVHDVQYTGGARINGIGAATGDPARVVAHLDGDPPDGVLALLVLDKDGSPRSWVRAPADGGAYTLYSPPGRCVGMMPGTIVSSAGDHVRFAWVDAEGRLSKLSSTFAITR